MFVMFLIIFPFISTSTLRTHIKSVACFTLAVTSVVGNKWVSIFTKRSFRINSGRAISFKNILFIANQLQMVGVYASSVIAKMMGFWRTFIIPLRNFPKFPYIKQAVCLICFTSPVNSSISVRELTSPIPTVGDWVNRNTGKNTSSFSFCKHSQIIPVLLANVNV